jgi:N4-gp56 family major capsid protein
MALSVTSTAQLQKPVNAVLQQTFLRNARARAPYFMGTQAADLIRHGGSATAKWRRIENLTPSTSAISEVTTSSYMQGRTPDQATFTDVTATVAKYGQFIILNEEVDVFNVSAQTDKIGEILGIAGGRSLDQLQRNVVEDNATLIYSGSATSDGATVSGVTLTDIKNAVNVLNRNSAMTFSAMTVGSENVGTQPILPAYWAICHPDVAIDVSALTGFKGVESYAGQVKTGLGEFGTITVAGQALRFIQTEDASIDTNSGGTTGSTGLRGSTNIDLYTISVYGMDALGSVGLGRRHTERAYMAGDALPSLEMIVKGMGSSGAGDPFNEIMTMAYKSWHAGAVLNSAWCRGIRCGATSLA